MRLADQRVDREAGAAVAATAADAVGVDAARLLTFGRDGPCVDDTDIAANVAIAAEAADAHGDHRACPLRRLRVHTKRACGRQAAIAAATADAVGKNPVRLLAERIDAAVVLDCHVAADIARAAVTADRDVEVARTARVGRGRRRLRERAGETEAAVAAAAADALGEHAIRELAHRQNVAGVGHADGAALAAAAALATEADADRGEIGRRGAGDGESAVAAAATEALRTHAVRLRTVRVDIRAGEDFHRAAVARCASGAADADRHLR